MLEFLIDRYGEGSVLAMTGLVIGLLFGASAQHSRFCLRAASVELSEGTVGPRLSIWLIAFCSGVALVQGSIALGWLDVSESRQLASVGSLSGAIIGGLMFGSGMILARGCASRLLVLSATGNLRALVTGLVLTLVAQASLRGVLAPAREKISTLWLVSGGTSRDILGILELNSGVAAFVTLFILMFAFNLARSTKVQTSHAVAASVVGVAVGLGWLLTYEISQVSFEVVPISSVTFTGPSTDTLMGLVNSTEIALSFGVGLVPGVFLGAGVMALVTREAKIVRFERTTPMERYLLGAALMGFGSMTAGGCAVGAGMSGGAIFALTAWVAVLCMWIGAIATQLLVARRETGTNQAPV